jgi:hypothetical protein
LPAIVWSGVAIAALIVIAIVWTARRGRAASTAWQEYYQVTTADMKVRPKRLKELAERYADTDIALWARLDLADQLCYEGRSKLEIDRELAVTLLREAQQTYAAVLAHPRVRPEMIGRAAIAEGKCWELLGDRAQAIDTYGSVAGRLSDSHPEVARQASQRAEALEQPEAAEFFKWFAEYRPPVRTPVKTPGLDFNVLPESDSSGAQDSEPEPTNQTEEPRSEPQDSSDEESSPTSSSPSSPPGADSPREQPPQDDEDDGR